jgi:hypothetical protein
VKREVIMIRLVSKKSSLFLAAVMLAKLASAQGLPWFHDPLAQTALEQTAAPEQTPVLKTMAPQVATTTDPSTVTIPAGDPGDDGPEEPAAYHVRNSGLWSLP